jgi:hypothetical protein
MLRRVATLERGEYDERKRCSKRIEPQHWYDAMVLTISMWGWSYTLRHRRPKPRSFTPETPGLSYWLRVCRPTTLMLSPMPRGCGAQ